MRLDVTAVRRRQKFLQPRRRPFDRTASMPGGVGGDDLLRINPGLHAEAAAHIADHDADLLGRDTERAGKSVAGAGRHLAGQAQRDAFGAAVVTGQRATRLHRRGRKPLVGQVEADDMRGRGERGIARSGVAVLHLSGDVAGGGRPDQRRALGNSLSEFGDDGQVVVLDDDGFQGVLRLFLGLGDQGNHGFANEADSFVRKRAAKRRSAGRAVRALEDRRKGNRINPGGGEIGPCQHGKHARHRGGGLGVDRDDGGVGVR